jgi:hypothetical protein
VIRVSRAEFNRVKAKAHARKAFRAQNAAYIEAVEALARPETARPASYACSTTRTSLKRATANIKRPRRISVKDKIKAIKKRVLGSGGLWSLAVRKRDHNRCLMRGKTETLQAHHWLFRRAHSNATAVEISNGVTLCYGCHIGRIHKDGDGDFVLQLAAKMTAMVGPEEIQRLRDLASVSLPLGLEWWQEAERRVKAAL